MITDDTIHKVTKLLRESQEHGEDLPRAIQSISDARKILGDVFSDLHLEMMIAWRKKEHAFAAGYAAAVQSNAPGNATVRSK